MAKAEILLASYNGARYIHEQIDSILQQTDDRWHLTVSDDGSTDGTADILDAYAAQYPDKITRLKSGKRFGNARDHFFYLIGQCDAEYIFTCDQDDRWYPDKVKKTLDVLVQTEKEVGKRTPVLVFSDQTPTDARLNPLAPSLMRYQNQFFAYFDYRSLLMQNVVTGGAMAFNRALSVQAMRCVDSTQTVMHDWWMAVVAARFGRIVYIDEPLGDYRQHGSNSVGAKNVRSIEHIVHKIAHLDEIRSTIVHKKRQASMFADTYGSTLLQEDLLFLRNFSNLRSGPLFYIRNRVYIHGLFRLAGMMVLG